MASSPVVVVAAAAAQPGVLQWGNQQGPLKS
jgi:hypothetical protein